MLLEGWTAGTALFPEDGMEIKLGRIICDTCSDLAGRDVWGEGMEFGRKTLCRAHLVRASMSRLFRHLPTVLVSAEKGIDARLRERSVVQDPAFRRELRETIDAEEKAFAAASDAFHAIQALRAPRGGSSGM